MQYLELLAPARNADIGIAAIACGADAVYIGGPLFGARKDAGNDLSEIGRLCDYAHRYGARVFLTVNVTVREEEWEELHRMMLEAQRLGVDAFIVRDIRIATWADITVPVHASTQCAIRTAEQAQEYARQGFSRIVLERELSLAQVRQIAASTEAEIECFVHGALCVGYSGDCYLSEAISGRSANRGECIQACRSLYDLVDGEGRILLKDKALLSLKDLNLLDRLGELAEAGVCSFKIEGRLKNASYVRNVVRAYSEALDALCAADGRFRRASFGQVRGAFRAQLDKTFNRGYTALYLDGRRSRGWSSMDTPKSMGEEVGTIQEVRPVNRYQCELVVKTLPGVEPFANGDGFSFVTGREIVGFRGDVCQGDRIRCKHVEGLRRGVTLYRNLSATFEKEMEAHPGRRLLVVAVAVRILEGYAVVAEGVSEDGRRAVARLDGLAEPARQAERILGMLHTQLGKEQDPYAFRVADVRVETADGSVPLLSAAQMNGLRRALAGELDRTPCGRVPLAGGPRPAEPLFEPAPAVPARGELLRSKYCLRYELGLCPVHQGATPPAQLYLLNNGRRFRLGFDCASCEMTVSL